QAPLPTQSLPLDAIRNDLPPPLTEIVVRLLDSYRTDHYTDFAGVLADVKSVSFPQPSTRLRSTIARPAASVATSPALSAGRVLAGRFKIVRFIARGGMGDVYEAEDLELRERVALKTVRPEIAGAPQALERFKREIQLARKVTHPNVCR